MLRPISNRRPGPDASPEELVEAVGETQRFGRADLDEGVEHLDQKAAHLGVVLQERRVLGQVASQHLDHQPCLPIRRAPRRSCIAAEISSA